MKDTQAKLHQLAALNRERQYFRTRMVEERALASSLPCVEIPLVDSKVLFGAGIEAYGNAQVLRDVQITEIRARLMIAFTGYSHEIDPASARKLAAFLLEAADQVETFNKGVDVETPATRKD